MNGSLPAGVILAGGRSIRMGGVNKALLKLNGISLVQHVITRLHPQVSSLVLSVEQTIPELESLGLEQVEDLRPGSHGPLGGLLAAMERTDQSTGQVLLCPCDAPLLPPDLGARLAERMAMTKSAVCAVRYEGRVQPTFSLWNCGVLPELRRAVLDDDEGGFMAFFERVHLATLDWPAEPVSPFFNVNTPGDLESASHILNIRASNQ